MPNIDFEGIKAKIGSIVAVASRFCEVSTKGGKTYCCCPVHGEDTPSMILHEDTGKFHCFGCGIGGDVFDFYGFMHGLGKVESVKKAAEDFGIALDYDNDERGDSRKEIRLIIKAANDFFVSALFGNGGKEAREYWKSRGLDKEDAVKCGIGYADGNGSYLDALRGFKASSMVESGLVNLKMKPLFFNRLMFPVYDSSGRIAGFSGRRINQDKKYPKYMNSAEGYFKKNEAMIGWKSLAESVEPAIISESTFDFAAISSAGFDSAVSCCGTALGERCISSIALRKERMVIICPHGDRAGVDFAIKKTAQFLDRGCEVRIAMHGRKDIAEVLENDGKEAVRKAISGAVGYIEYIRAVSGTGSSIKPVLMLLEHMKNEDAKTGVRFSLGGETCASKPQTVPEKEPSPAVSVDDQQSISTVNEFAIASLIHGDNRDEKAATLMKSVALNEFERAVVLECAKTKNGKINTGAVPDEKVKGAISTLMEEPVCENAFDSGDFKINLKLPEKILKPGGLIEQCITGLAQAGCPDYPVVNLPLALSTIGAAVAGKLRCGYIVPAFYHIRVMNSGFGKTEASTTLTNALLSAGCGEMVGPEKFASGPAIVSSLASSNVMLCFFDEVDSMIAGDKTGKDQNLKGKVSTLLELHSQNGGRYRYGYADGSRNNSIDWFFFSFCGNTVPMTMDGISSSSLRNGLVGRANFFCRKGFIEKRKPKGDSSILDSFANSISALRRDAGHQNSQESKGYCGGAFSLSLSEVQREMSSIEDYILDRVNKDIDNDVMSSIITRIYNDTIRYAIVHLVSSRPKWCIYDPIDTSDIDYGFVLASVLAQWKIDAIVNNLTTGVFAEDCQVFLDACYKQYARYVNGQGGRPTRKSMAGRRKEIDNWTPRYYDEIVSALIDAGKIESAPGRGGKVYVPNIKRGNYETGDKVR